MNQGQQFLLVLHRHYKEASVTEFSQLLYTLKEDLLIFFLISMLLKFMQMQPSSLISHAYISCETWQCWTPKTISQAGIIWQESVLMSQGLDLMGPLGSALAVYSYLSGLGISHTPLRHTRHTHTPPYLSKHTHKYSP